MMGDAMTTKWMVRHASIAVSVMLAGLAACSGLPNEDRQVSRSEPLLFIDCFHTRERTCVGFYLDDGELVGGFLGVEGMVWPITIRERLSESRYRVDSRIGILSKLFPTEWDLEIKVGSKFDWRLKYSMRESFQDLTYSGEAVSPAILAEWDR